MALYDPNGFLGVILFNLSNNITGNDIVSLFFIIVALIGFLALFRVPVEIYAILSLPLLIVLSLYNYYFSVFLVVDILILGAILYKYLFD